MTPPTCPPVGSSGLVKKLIPPLSVYPYPSYNGHCKAIFKKDVTSAEIGAAPVTIP